MKRRKTISRMKKMTWVMSPMMVRLFQIDTEAPLNGFYRKTLLFQVCPEDGAISPDN